MKRADAQRVKRADPQRVKRADPQRVKTSENQRDDEPSTETARCCSGDHSPDQQFDGETVEDKISHSTVQDVRGQNKTRRHYYEEANDPIYVADSSDQDRCTTLTRS